MPKKVKEKPKKMVIVEEVSTEEETPEIKVEEKVDKKEESKIPEKKEEVVETEAEEKKEETSKVEEKKEELKDETDKPNYLWIIIPTALLVGALVGGLITYFSGVSKLNEDEMTPTPISSELPSEKASPEASPAGELKRDALKIQVLNGSGIGGAAGKAKTYLEGLGYVEVDAGNAASSDFAETEISIKDSVKDYLDLITTDLSKNYEVASTTSTLVTTSKYDVVVTIGTK